MKKTRLQTIALSISLLITLLFLTHITTNYDWLSSISKSSKYLTQDANDYMFFIWVWSLSGAMAFVGNSKIIGIGAGILTIIATYTGWNPAIEQDNFEDTVHIIATNIGVGAIIIEMVRRGIQEIDDRIMTIFMVFTFIVFTVFAIVLKLPNHTFWIEIYVLTIAYTYYFKKLIKI